MSILSGSDFVRDHFREAAFARSRRAVEQELEGRGRAVDASNLLQDSFPDLAGLADQICRRFRSIVIWTLILHWLLFSCRGRLQAVCLLFSGYSLNERLPGLFLVSERFFR